MVSRIQNAKESVQSMAKWYFAVYDVGRARTYDKLLLGVVTTSRPCRRSLDPGKTPTRSRRQKEKTREKAID